MPLLKSGKLVNDPWVHWFDDEPEPEGVQVIVSLRNWRENRESLINREGPLGIRLTSEQVPGDIRDDFEHFDVIALEFPAFTDGRSYSNARRLRQRFNYKGEVRAVGNVLCDQYLALTRCGFDALEVKNDNAEEEFQKAVTSISTPFQPALDGQPTAMSLRQRRKTG
jgi:uncharacterized protein (DUF934 family)